LQMMDLGAEEIIDIEDDKIKIEIKIENLKLALDKIKEIGLEVDDSGLEWVAKDMIKVDSEIENRLNNLFGQLEEHDDVEDYFTNAE